MLQCANKCLSNMLERTDTTVTTTRATPDITCKHPDVFRAFTRKKLVVQRPHKRRNIRRTRSPHQIKQRSQKSQVQAACVIMVFTKRNLRWKYRLAPFAAALWTLFYRTSTWLRCCFFSKYTQRGTKTQPQKDARAHTHESYHDGGCRILRNTPHLLETATTRRLRQSTPCFRSNSFKGGSTDRKS